MSTPFWNIQTLFGQKDGIRSTTKVLRRESVGDPFGQLCEISKRRNRGEGILELLFR